MSLSDSIFFCTLMRVLCKIKQLAGCIVTILVLPIIMIVAFSLRIKRSFISEDEKKFFVGLYDVCGNVFSIADCLLSNGVSCRAFFYTDVYREDGAPKKFMNRHFKRILSNRTLHKYFYDIVLPVYFISYLINSNIFWFISKNSFLPLKIDYAIIRLAKANLVVMHCGSDVRYRPMHNVIHQKYCPDIIVPGDASTLSFLRSFYAQIMGELFARVISSRNQATFQRGRLISFYFSQEPLLKNSKKTNTKPIIIHAPSRRNIKGTDIVLEAIEKLESWGLDFEFEILEEKPNNYVLSRLVAADIVLDQPGTWPAKLAVEAMAAGCCVIGGNQKSFMGRYDSPVIQFKKDSNLLANSLRELIINPNFRKKQMERCFEFWNDNYSPEAMYKYIIKVLDGKQESFDPFPDQKELVLSGSQSWVEYLIVKMFYHPRYL